MAEFPWSKFFWSDWESDQGLRLCSLAAQGLWMRLLCVCARHEPKGYLAINGNPLGLDAIARLAGVAESEVGTLMDELDRNGVFSRDRKGRIYSRRMVRDEKCSKEGRKHKLRGLSQATEKDRKNPQPSREPARGPSPQKPEARSQKEVSANAATSQAQEQGRAWPDDRGSDALLDAVMTAVGVTGPSIPTHWMPPAATLHVQQWRTNLGLSVEQIVEVARESRKRHTDPPNGPKALDAAMRRLAAVLANSTAEKPSLADSADARRHRWRKIAGAAA